MASKQDLKSKRCEDCGGPLINGVCESCVRAQLEEIPEAELKRLLLEEILDKKREVQ